MLSHGLDEFLTCLWRTVLVLPIEGRSLVVPYEGVAEHPHVVVFSVLYVFVSLPEIPYVGTRVHYLCLKAVLWRDCIEVLEDKVVGLGESTACM